MKRTKKTTLMIDESVLDQVKRKAVEEGKSVSLVVAEALRAYIASPVRRPCPEFDLISSGSGGPILPEGIDINDTSEVLGYLDQITLETEGINRLR